MRAGKLRHLLEFWKPTGETPGADGDTNPEYVRAFEVWGAIEPLSDRELWQAQQVKADVTHKITVRGGIQAGPAYRIQWNNRRWELGPPISTDERGRDYIFTATETTWQKQ